MGESYYKQIDGKKYDKQILDAADEAVAGQGDGRISKDDAAAILEAVKDGDSYTDIEKATVKYVRANYRFTVEGDEWLRTEIRKWAAERGHANKEDDE